MGFEPATECNNNIRTGKIAQRRILNLIEASLGSVSCGGDFLFLGANKVAEDGKQLKVAGRRHVVVAT